MGKWEVWSKKLYEKYGKKIQPTYDNIASWKMPEEVKSAAELLWPLIPRVLREKIYNMAKSVIDKAKDYDSEYAKKLIEDFIKKLKDLFNK